MADFIYGVRGAGKKNVLSPTTNMNVVMKTEFLASQSTFELRLTMLVTVSAELSWI